MKKAFALLLALSLLLAMVPASAANYVSVGSTVYFGHYEQDGRYNSKEAIPWIVLDVRGGSALLLSQYVLDAMPWNTSTYTVQWYSCTLNSWLNYSFYNEAFSWSEQNAINSYLSDPVFLLSYDEVRTYLSRWNLCAMPTRYAMNRGVYVSGSYSWWWTRTVGSRENQTWGVNTSGVLNEFHMRKESGGIRPAIWVSISALP